MALNKNDLLSLIAGNLPDNTNQEITPADVREVLQQMVTADLNLEELTEQFLLGMLKVKGIQFDNTTPNPPWSEGQAFYDSEAKALSYYNSISDTTINMGQEVVIKVYNGTASTIANGSVARYSGLSVSNVPAVELAFADTVSDAAASGIATHSIPPGTVGFITAIGSVGDVNTSGFDEGDVLYVSGTTPGELTNIAPSIVNAVAVATVIGSGNGKIFTSLSRVEDPKAFAQNTQGIVNVLPITAIPIPVEGFTESPFSRNATVQTPIGAEGDPRTIISPESNPFGGYYDVSFSMIFSASSNVVVVAEIYVNGQASGVKSISDVSNSQIDDGSCVIPRALTQSPISPSDELEVYVYTTAGTTNITMQSLLINATRVGNI